MRKVAEKLGTGAASLYAHVRDKAELHELMLDEAFREVAVPEPDPGYWTTQLKQLALKMTEVLASRPGIARIALETLIPTTPHALDGMDRMLGILRAGGLSDADALAGADALALYVTAGSYERGLRSTARMAQEAQERIGRIREYLAIVPPGRLPHLAALSLVMGVQTDGYELGLELLIDGLASRAARGVSESVRGPRASEH